MVNRNFKERVVNVFRMIVAALLAVPMLAGAQARLPHMPFVQGYGVDLTWQQLIEAELDDRVRLAAANFHQHPRPGS